MLASALIVAALAAQVPEAKAPAVAITRFDDDPEGDQRRWLGLRFPMIVARAAERIGLATRDHRLLEKGSWSTPDGVRRLGLAAVVTGNVNPKALEEPSGSVVVAFTVHRANGAPVSLQLAGPADELERLAGDVALKIAEQVGLEVPKDIRALLPAREQPFQLHKLLAQAEMDLDAGQPRRALLKYDRAAEVQKELFDFDALDGVRRAQAALTTREPGTVPGKPDLAQSALDRAENARRRNDAKEALIGLSAFFRYTPDRALRWTIATGLDSAATRIVGGDDLWLVQTGPTEAASLWTVDPRTGAIMSVEPGARGLIAVAGRERITLDGRTLKRQGAGPKPRWTLKLPLAPAPAASQHVVPGGGQVAIAGDRGIVWVDVSLGTISRIVDDVRLLDAGTDGAAVMTRKGQLAFLRPGRSDPAWTFAVSELGGVAVSRERVIFLDKGKLHVVQTIDGKPRLDPLTVGSGARIIGVEGRYGVIARSDKRAVVLDVLQGTRTATVRGPGTPVAATTTQTGVAIAYDTGDVIGFDRDGVLLDRGRVEGTPFAMLPGPALAPGAVVFSTGGVWSFGDWLEPGKVRDVDGLVRMAELLATTHPDAALRFAESIARRSAGRLGEIETLRAKLYEKRGDPASKAAAKWATTRAAAARDPSKPLPRFKLLGN